VGLTDSCRFLIISGWVASTFDIKDLREMASLIKRIEFMVVPLVQIFSSPPLKKYIFTEILKKYQ
jgi:hypothetical protein